MLWECWVNDDSLTQSKKDEHMQLLTQCGFKFEEYAQEKKKK